MNIKFSVETVWHCCDLEIQSRSLKVVWMGKAQWVLPSCKVNNDTDQIYSVQGIPIITFLPHIDTLGWPAGLTLIITQTQIFHVSKIIIKERQNTTFSTKLLDDQQTSKLNTLSVRAGYCSTEWGEANATKDNFLQVRSGFPWTQEQLFSECKWQLHGAHVPSSAFARAFTRPLYTTVATTKLLPSDWLPFFVPLLRNLTAGQQTYHNVEKKHLC